MDYRISFLLHERDLQGAFAFWESRWISHHEHSLLPWKDFLWSLEKSHLTCWGCQTPVFLMGWEPWGSADNPFSSLPGKMESELVCQRELGFAPVLIGTEGGEGWQLPCTFLLLVPTQERESITDKHGVMNLDEKGSDLHITAIDMCYVFKGICKFHAAICKFK